jgi:hypothetical protein
VLVGIGERNVVELRAGKLLIVIGCEQLSRRRAVAWLGGTFTIGNSGSFSSLSRTRA